jgi:hypothetical protein
MSNVTIRPKWYSIASWPPLCGIAVCCVLAYVAKSHGLFGVAAVLVSAWVISMFGTTIELTATDVGIRLCFFGRRAAQRDAISAMHWFSGSLTWVDRHNSLLLRISSIGWTRSQVVELAEAIGVPLYNHRTKRGWGNDARIGQVIQRADQLE